MSTHETSTEKHKIMKRKEERHLGNTTPLNAATTYVISKVATHTLLYDPPFQPNTPDTIAASLQSAPFHPKL